MDNDVRESLEYLRNEAVRFNEARVSDHCSVTNRVGRISVQADLALAGVAALENKRDEFERRIDNINRRLDEHQERLHVQAKNLDSYRESLCAAIKRVDCAVIKRAEEELKVRVGGVHASPRAVCLRYGVQSCHFCERLACGDNTSPGATLLRAAKHLLKKPKDASERDENILLLEEAIKDIEAMG